MLRVALRGLAAHKVRLLLTTLAVVLGVAFVTGSFVLTDSMGDAFRGLFADITSGTDAYVRSATEADEDATRGFTSAREPLPEDLLERIEQVEGVARADGWVEGFAQVVGPDGEAVGSQGPPRLGFSWSDMGGPLFIRDGRPPRGPGEVVLDAGTIDRTGYAVGDEVPVITPAGTEEFTLVGVAGFGQSDNLLGATIAAFELDEARRLFDKQGQFDQIGVVGDGSVPASELEDRLAAALDGDVEVVTAQQSVDEGLEDIQGFLSTLTNVLLGFAFVALVVSAFIITNTFSIVVAQRMREFALLRAVGASRRQVARAVRLEAVTVGLVASLLGLGLGVGLAEGLKGLMRTFGLDVPTGGVVLQPRTVVWALVVGVGVTFVSVLLPARRAGRVAPVEAMRGAALSEEPTRLRVYVGAAVAVVGGAVFAVGAFARPANAAALVAAGALLVLLGVAALSPLLAGPIARVVGALPARLSASGRIARGNAARDRRRTGTTASALMVGLALVTFATVVAASANRSVAGALDEQFAGDLAISTDQPGFYGLPPSVGDQVASLPEIATVSRVRLGRAQLQGDVSMVAGVEPDTVGSGFGLGVVAGRVTELSEGQAFLEVDRAEELGVDVGDTISVVFTRTGGRELEVAGLFENADLVSAPVLIPLSSYAENFTSQLDAWVMATVAPGVGTDAATRAVEDVLDAHPNATVRDQEGLRAEAEQQINRALALMTVLLGLAIVVALLGITNTLALAVFERTREIGLLRAVGMTRRQVRAMVRWESTIVAVFGAVLGVLVGSLFGWALVRALADEGFERLAIPVGQLALYVVVAALAGVVAAAFPARRASRLDVLAAVTTE